VGLVEHREQHETRHRDRQHRAEDAQSAMKLRAAS
jgi:hypothetical protein